MALAVSVCVAHAAGVLDQRDDAHDRTMAGRAVAAALAGLAVIVMTAAACAGSGTTDSSAVEKLLNRQLELAKAADWQGLYNTYSPRYQSRCPYESLLRRASGYDAAALKSLAYDQLHVTIDGDQAQVTYVTTLDGKVIAAVTDASPDLYVKIDGTWFDEYDELTVCS